MSDQHREPQARRTSRAAIGRSSIPAELPILPLAGHGPLSEFVHAARRRARELRPPHRRRDRQRQADRRLHAARRGGRGAGAGRPVPGRHRDPHPQDVQAARRQPAPDRPGPRAPDAGRGGRDAALPARPRHDGGRRRSTTPTASRSTRSRATSRRTSSRWSRCRRCSPTICRRWRRTSPSRAGSPTSSPRRSRRSAPP